MKKTLRAMLVGCSGLALAAFLVVPQAQAITTKAVAANAQSLNANYTFILGEDGGVWYTVTTVDPANRTLRIGNANNPFNAITTNVRGLVSSATLSTNCGLSGFTCSGIFAKIPGAGAFQSNPIVVANAPYVSGAGGIGGVGVFNIIATGTDNNVWYTVYDNTGTGGTAGGILGSSVAAGFLPNEAFTGVGESNDTGHPLAGAFTTSCSTLARICVGLWEKVE